MNPKERTAQSVIHRVECQERRIRLEASDEIMVAKVFMTIFDEQDKILEMGDTVWQEGGWWEFVPRALGKNIRVQAGDLASNHTQMVV